jgi:hypothetical protein
MKRDVSSIKVRRGQLKPGESTVLGLERGAPACKYGECVYSFDNLPFCDWIRNTCSESKCVAKTSDNRAIGVDGRKIKYRVTSDEISLKKQVIRFMKVAVKVDKEERKKERRAAIERQRCKVRQIVQEIEEERALTEMDVVGASKYNITSLV